MNVFLAAILAGVVAILASARLIHKKLDTIMATQLELDNKLTELKTAIAAEAQAAIDANQRVIDRLATLNPQSPDFTSEVEQIQADLDTVNASLATIQGIAPATPTATAPAPEA